jgi:hypothetical protein
MSNDDQNVSFAFCDEASFIKRVECALSQASRRRSNFLMQLDVCRAHDIRELSGGEALDAVHTLVRGIVCKQLGSDVPGLIRPDCALSLLLADTSRRIVAVQAREILTCIDGEDFRWMGHPFRLGAHVGLVELGDTSIPAHAWLMLARETCKAAEELGGSGIRLVSGGAQAWRDLQQDRAWHDHLAEII